MKLKYLGTAAADGIPALFCECEICQKAQRIGGKNIRTRSQAMIDNKILIDFPPDTYMHMLQYGIRLGSVKTCLITHAHADHLYSKDFIMRNPLYTHRKDDSVPLHVYTGKSGFDMLTETMASMPAEQRTVKPVCLTAFQSFTVEVDYKITPVIASHAPATSPFLFLVEKDGKTLFYANDSGEFCKETLAELAKLKKPLQLVSLDCTLGTEETDGKSHLNLQRCVAVKERFLKEGIADGNTQFVLTHFSHNGGDALHDTFSKRAEEHGLIAAYDGMELEV